MTFEKLAGARSKNKLPLDLARKDSTSLEMQEEGVVVQHRVIEVQKLRITD
jgi:hypothetical protein